MKILKVLILLLIIFLLSCSKSSIENNKDINEIEELYNLITIKYNDSYKDFKQTKGNQYYKDVDRIRQLSDEILLGVDNKNIDNNQLIELSMEMSPCLPKGENYLAIEKDYLNDYKYRLLIKTKIQLLRLICMNDVIDSHKKSYFQCELIGVRPIIENNSKKIGNMFSLNLIPFYTSSEIKPSLLIVENDTLFYNNTKGYFTLKNIPNKRGVFEKDADIIVERWGEIRKIPIGIKYDIK